MKSFTRTVLEYLTENKELLINAFIPPHPRSRLARSLLGLDSRKHRKEIKRTSLSSILSRLKKDGLISRTGTNSKSAWKITSKGKSYLKEHGAYKYSEPHILLPRDGVYRLFTFDIPEEERKKREWLRGELIAHGYKMLQKSVFFGDRPLSEDLIKEIDILNMQRYVHIISISKLGTITQKI